MKDNKTTSAQTDKTYHLISGLPRSGSTLLCNILNQNPKFHATPTSGVLQMLLTIRNNWNKISAFSAVRNEPAKLRVLRGMLHNFYSDVDQEIIFDKNRGWPGNFETIEALLEYKPKMLVTVRDVRDVLASFEQLWRKESRTGQTPQERGFPEEMKTITGRCEVLMRSSQPVGDAYNKMKDALLRGHGENMFFITFESLTKNPEEVMREVYDFLEEPYFEHDFENVEQSTKEDDFFHGFTDLHTIRQQVRPVASYWRDTLGSFAESFGKFNFWKKNGIQPKQED